MVYYFVNRTILEQMTRWGINRLARKHARMPDKQAAIIWAGSSGSWNCLTLRWKSPSLQIKT